MKLLIVRLMYPIHTSEKQIASTFPLSLPLAKAMATTAAASITHDNGFHINPKNFRILLS